METNIYKGIKKLVLFGSLLGFIVFFAPMTYKLFGSLCWFLLILIVYARPLSDILPDVGFLKKIVCMRKELGIMCATFGIAHGVGYFLAHNTSFIGGIFSSSYWDISTGFGWGMLALAISIPLLLTSNAYSMKLLGKNWKNIQRFTYLFFVFSAIHIAMIKPNDTTSSVILVSVWVILWILSYKNIKIEFKNKNISYAILTLVFLGVGFGMFYGGDSRDHTKPQEQVGTQTISSSTSSGDSTTLVGQVSTKKIYISDRCIGCGKCARMAPLYFSMNGEKAEVIKQDNIDETLINKIARQCHADAITLA